MAISPDSLFIPLANCGLNKATPIQRVAYSQSCRTLPSRHPGTSFFPVVSPEPPESVSVVDLGLDDTCMFMTDDGRRQAMVAAIAFFNCHCSLVRYKKRTYLQDPVLKTVSKIPGKNLLRIRVYNFGNFRIIQPGRESGRTCRRKKPGSHLGCLE